MFGIKTRKDKEIFLTTIITKLNIDQNEKEIYFLSLEILDDQEFNNFYNKIFDQVTQDGEINDGIEAKTLAPFSANIL